MKLRVVLVQGQVVLVLVGGLALLGAIMFKGPIERTEHGVGRTLTFCSLAQLLRAG